MAKRIAANHPEVTRIILFGSVARKDFGVRSDLDLLILLKSSQLPIRERIGQFLSECSSYPTDVFPLTDAELESRLQSGDPFWVQALREGIECYRSYNEDRGDRGGFGRTEGLVKTIKGIEDLMDHTDLGAARRQYTVLLERSLQLLVEVLKQRPDILRISVFGSYARGRADLFTDLDVFVVMDSTKPIIERQRELYELLALPVDLDLLCYTPREFEDLKNQPFLRYALAGEKVLYEKKPT